MSDRTRRVKKNLDYNSIHKKGQRVLKGEKLQSENMENVGEKRLNKELLNNDDINEIFNIYDINELDTIEELSESIVQLGVK